MDGVLGVGTKDGGRVGRYSGCYRSGLCIGRAREFQRRIYLFFVW